MRKFASHGVQNKQNWLYIFAAWNAFGLCLYQFLTRDKRFQTEEWKNMSSTQRYMAMTQDPEKEIKVIHMKGFRKVGEETLTNQEFFTPPKPPQPAQQTDE